MTLVPSARAFASGLLGGLVAGIALMVLLPVVLGWRPYTVLTGSMRPVIQPGDVVMDRPVKAINVKIGDVITFSDPSREGALVTHRVRSLKRLGGRVEVETRGDANNASERWTIAREDPVGKVVYVLPKIGHVGHAIRTPVGLIALFVLPLLALGFLALRQIWRDEPAEPEREPPPSP